MYNLSLSSMREQRVSRTVSASFSSKSISNSSSQNRLELAEVKEANKVFARLSLWASTFLLLLLLLQAHRLEAFAQFVSVQINTVIEFRASESGAPPSGLFIVLLSFSKSAARLARPVGKFAKFRPELSQRVDAFEGSILAQK